MGDKMEHTQQNIINQLAQLEDELDVYDYFIEKAFQNREMDIRKPEYQVKGCVSGLWVKAELQNGIVAVYTDSDSLLIKGIAATISDIYNGMTLEEAKKVSLTFLDAYDLAGELDESRKRGLSHITKKIRALEGENK